MKLFHFTRHLHANYCTVLNFSITENTQIVFFSLMISCKVLDSVLLCYHHVTVVLIYTVLRCCRQHHGGELQRLFSSPNAIANVSKGMRAVAFAPTNSSSS